MAVNFPDDVYSNIKGLLAPWTLTNFLGFLVTAMEPPYGAATNKLLLEISCWKDIGYSSNFLQNINKEQYQLHCHTKHNRAKASYLSKDIHINFKVHLPKVHVPSQGKPISSQHRRHFSARY